MPVEQINNTTGTVSYLHHDQAGSTRLITGSTGKTEATFTYGPYGELTGSTGTVTTPLGYDGQYTSSDTGLIYLRARIYDPATGQFLSVDPFVEATRAPYGFAAQTPLTFTDPTGFFALPLVGSLSADADAACGVTWEVPGLDAVTCGAAAAGTAYLGARLLSATITLATEEQDDTKAEVSEGEPEAEQTASEPCTVPRRSLPREGEPNSTDVLDRGNGSGQIRDYGPDGLPERDFDLAMTTGSVIRMPTIGLKAFGRRGDRLNQVNRSMRHNTLQWGWNPDLDIPSAIARLNADEIADGYALLAVIDSSPQVRQMADVVDLLTSMETSYDELGGGIVVEMRTLLSLMYEHEALHGFDEVWLFREMPSESKPEAIPLTSDVRLEESPSNALIGWMSRCQCIAGLGDGDGLNFVTLRPLLADLWRAPDV